MSRKLITMRKVKEVYRLYFELGLSSRKIASALKMGRTTVRDYVSRAKQAGLTVEEIKTYSEDELQASLFIKPASTGKYPVPDWKEIHLEHKTKKISLQVLWEEYLEINPDGYCYGHFCELYQAYAKTLHVTMRQLHKAGDKMFVDYCGDTVKIIDRNTGEEKKAQIFVAVLGGSNYLFAEATWSQSSADWISSHVHALEFFGGVSKAIVPDNLKSGVTKSNYYDPDINIAYAEFAAHYSTAILPARVKKPKDKSKAEGGVQYVQNWLLAKLRNLRFFTLSDLNSKINELVIELNKRPFKKLPGCRTSMFEDVEKAALQKLPTTRYEYSDWKQAKVNIDYHVEYKKFFYSVPWQNAHARVFVRATSTTIEVFIKDKRIASHLRKFSGDRYNTQSEHMPPHHKFVKWSPGRLISNGEKIGIPVKIVVENIINSKRHPEQGFRSALGIFRLGDKVGNIRLINACKVAIGLQSLTYKTVRTILENGQDRKADSEISEDKVLPEHSNIRGASYYKEDLDYANATND